MRLRPYKSCDSKVFEKWIKDEEVFRKWGGERFGIFPINANIIDDKYCKKNGDCVEEDNFYPWTAIDENNNIVGHLLCVIPVEIIDSCGLDGLLLTIQ